MLEAKNKVFSGSNEGTNQIGVWTVTWVRQS